MTAEECKSTNLPGQRLLFSSHATIKPKSSCTALHSRVQWCAWLQTKQINWEKYAILNCQSTKAGFVFGKKCCTILFELSGITGRTPLCLLQVSASISWAYFRLPLLICKCCRQGQQFVCNLIAQRVKSLTRQQQQTPRDVSHYQSNHVGNACHNHSMAGLITIPHVSPASAMLSAAKRGMLNEKLTASFLCCTEWRFTKTKDYLRAITAMSIML